MSERLKTLEADIAAARRIADRDRLKVLTLLLSKIQRVAKDDGNRAVTDEDVIQGVSRYRKEVDEAKALLGKAGRDTTGHDAELAIVTAYLPAQMTADELDAEIEKALNGTDRTRKAMGVVMKHLNERFKGRFDPKAANAAITAKLS